MICQEVIKKYNGLANQYINALTPSKVSNPRVHPSMAECVQHKGGQLVSVYKRKGEIADPSNHRALLVSSCLSKAFHNAFRRRTMPYVHSHSGDLQISSHSKPSALTAAHAVRTHLNGTRRMGYSSFALFVDISQAFYRVLRQLAFGADHSDEHTVTLLRRLGFEDFCIQDIADKMEEQNALQELDCPPFLQGHIREMHSNTWFNLVHDSAIVGTHRGTRPGDGYADVIWALVFSRWIHSMEQRLHSSGAFLYPIFGTVR